MQVESINNQTPNFGALKKITIEGRYLKKNPQVAKDILDTLKPNEAFKKFCEKHDASIILKSYEDGNKVVAIGIFYNKITDKNTKIGEFIDKMQSFFSKPADIVREGYGWSFDDAVKKLKEHFNDKDLYYSFNNACETTDKEAKDKADKLAQKLAEKQAKSEAEQQHSAAEKDLQDSIKSMIDNN